MSRLIKWYALAAILALISLSIYAAGGGNDDDAPFPVPLSCYSEIAGSPNFLEDGCDRVHGIENFKDPEGADMVELLSHRISANPFNLIASLIFLLAIIHTFMANKLTAYAHEIHEEHDERMKEAGASDEEIKHDIPFKAELFHFLGEVEVIFGLWVIVPVSYTHLTLPTILLV